MKRTSKRRMFGHERHLPGVLVRQTTTYTQDDLADAPSQSVLEDIDHLAAQAAAVLERAGLDPAATRRADLDELSNEYRAAEALHFAACARQALAAGNAEDAVWAAMRLVQRVEHIGIAEAEQWTATGRAFHKRTEDTGGRPGYSQAERELWQRLADEYWQRHPDASKSEAARFVARQDSVRADADLIRRRIEKKLS